MNFDQKTTPDTAPVSPPELIPFGNGTWLRCDVPELHPRLEAFGFRNGEANIMSGIPAKAVAAGLVSFPTKL